MSFPGEMTSVANITTELPNPRTEVSENCCRWMGETKASFKLSLNDIYDNALVKVSWKIFFYGHSLVLQRDPQTSKSHKIVSSTNVLFIGQHRHEMSWNVNWARYTTSNHSLLLWKICIIDNKKKIMCVVDTANLTKSLIINRFSQRFHAFLWD